MSQSPEINDLGQLLRDMAGRVVKRVEADLKGLEWQHILLDVRYRKNGSSWISKIRVSTQERGLVSVRMSNEIDLLLITLNSLRCVLKDVWYGLKMEIDHTQQCQTTMDYNPDCSADKSFYDA